MSSFTSTPNFDNLLLQTLMGRLQIQPPAPSNNHPSLSRALEDLLLDAANNFSEESDDDHPNNNKYRISREESKVEREIIRIILSGKTDSLNPNSGQAVTICDHHICIGFHQEKESDYRVWEWHGHIMLFDEENGYSPEYIYGNYFERLLSKAKYGGGISEGEEKEEEETKEVEEVMNVGLRDLIDGGNSKGSARILHRNINGSSSSSLILLICRGSILTVMMCPFGLMESGRKVKI